MPTTPGKISDPPDAVTDVTLLRNAQGVKQRHQQSSEDGTCGFCGTAWPCPPWQLAEQADEVSRAPRSQWHRTHTMHADLTPARQRMSSHLCEASGARRSRPRPAAGGTASCA